jgi:hypothetical protein
MKNFVEYSEFLLKFWMNICQHSSIFHGMNKTYWNLADIWQFFHVILTIFTLNILDFYRF